MGFGECLVAQSVEDVEAASGVFACNRHDGGFVVVSCSDLGVVAVIGRRGFG